MGSNSQYLGFREKHLYLLSHGGALFLINPGIIDPLQMIILRGYNVGRVILAGLKVGKYLL